MNKDLILREKLALQRTVLANQTTFLAFIRTALYFLIAGITLNNLMEIRFGQYIAITFEIISAILFILGILNFRFQHKRIQESKRHIGKYVMEYKDE